MIPDLEPVDLEKRHVRWDVETGYFAVKPAAKG